MHSTLTLRLTAALAVIALATALALTAQSDPDKEKDKDSTPPPAPAPKPAAKKKQKKAPAAFKHPPAVDLRGRMSQSRLIREGHQFDFPDLCPDPNEGMWIAYIDHDGESDTLSLSRHLGVISVPIATLSERGSLHQPAISVDGSGTVWVAWGQTGDDGIVHLHARSFADGKLGEIITLAESAGSDSFADAATDAAGRVWVTWQSMRAGEGDIFARVYDPTKNKWSDEIAVATGQGGDWEPRIAFAGDDNAAWIVYDSSRGNEFNLYLARVELDGEVKTTPIAHTPRYEARASIAASADGKGLWIAAERGRVRWGLDARGHQNDKGLNAQKEILFGHFDIASKTYTEHPLGPAGEAGAPVNLPSIGVDDHGRPWVAYRYFARNLWRIALTRFDTDKEQWSSRRAIAQSSHGQDRRASLVRSGDEFWIGWPSDLRTNKTCLEAGVSLASLDTDVEFIPAAEPGEPKDLSGEPFAPSQATPERPADDRHTWNFDGKKFGLYWGDVHRHTDVSNCRTGFDGCIVEHFRYAYDIAKLDFLGTSDHTDIAKIYDPYEWWHNQRLADVFHSPRQFNSLYVYEREQRWPWGHRNVVFAKRGGPIVYIQRANYRNSPWQKTYPVEAGLGEIEPPELWRVLKAHGEPVAVVSHTGATGMGTDWGRYDQSGIDTSVENLVEIFQGARVSYEGVGAPQPTAGHRPDEAYTVNGDGKHPQPPAPIEDFGKYQTGVYQNALDLGHRLGVFASSDHISQHVSYGGIYTEDFTREGIIEAMNARRTMAATDKIYLEFSCNGQTLGSIFETAELPRLKIHVDGTAALKRVTVVRNEQNYRVFEGDDLDDTTFAIEWTDESPLAKAENRYYLRVEQIDGNMAWSSPVWVTHTAK